MDGKKKFANNIEKEKQERKCVAMSAELPLSPKNRLTKAYHKTRQSSTSTCTTLNNNMAFLFNVLFR